MITKFVKRFEEHKKELQEKFAAKHPDSYGDIVRAVVEVIGDENEYCIPDPDRIHCIDDGDYQGTLVYVIAATGYQPDTYWSVKVGYGSCSVCDVLQAIRDDYDHDLPNEQQVKDYMGLALNIVQGLRPMQEDHDN